MTASETNGARRVREQLALMATSSVFRGAGRMHPLLEYLIAAELAGDGAQLNQYRIAIDALGRDARFDPSSDSIVRVEAGRLRNKLREYYAAEGSRDRIRFELPKGSYRPRIIDTGAAGPETAAGQAERRRTRSVRAPALAGVGILAAVAVGLTFELHNAEPRTTGVGGEGIGPGTPLTSAQAYELYLAVATATPEQRLRLMAQAIEVDPAPAYGHAFKAYLHSQGLTNTAWGPAARLPAREAETLIRRHAETALSLDKGVPYAGVALGNLYLFTWRWPQAREAYERAAAVDPDAAQLLHYSYLDAFAGHHAEAVKRLERLTDAEPGETALVSILGLAQAFAGDLDAAAESLRRGVTTGSPMNRSQQQSALVERSWLALVELARGDTDAALRELDLLRELRGVGFQGADLPLLAYAYSRLGRDVDARLLFREIERMAGNGARIGAGGWAMAHLAVGNEADARGWLETAARKAAAHEPDEDFFSLMFLRRNLLADPRLAQPAFAAVLERIHGG